MSPVQSQNAKNYIGAILLDFPTKIEYIVQQQGCAENGLPLDAPVAEKLEAYFGKFEKVFMKEVSPGNKKFGHIAVFTGAKGVTATIRTYPERARVTITIEYDLHEFNGVSPLEYNEIKLLEESLTQEFSDEKKSTKALPEVKRNLPFDIYFTTSDDRLLEYEIKEMVFDDRSDFQHVQIARSVNYGNILILDDLVNLAEADLTYTEAIMGRGRIDYTGKDILILGGGDGALLYELRKENANSITMIDIDDMVMRACKQHLRKACEDTLDNYKHDNYEIIVGDCIAYMEKCQSENKQFDFVFGDLTDIPISPTPVGEIWDFIKTCLHLSFAVLKPDGVYLTHANGISASESLDMFECTISKSLDNDVTIQKSYAFVPSFKEKWVFYQIERKNKQQQ